jgi:hypothetical protein
MHTVLSAFLICVLICLPAIREVDTFSLFADFILLQDGGYRLYVRHLSDMSRTSLLDQRVVGWATSEGRLKILFEESLRGKLKMEVLAGIISGANIPESSKIATITAFALVSPMDTYVAFQNLAAFHRSDSLYCNCVLLAKSVLGWRDKMYFLSHASYFRDTLAYCLLFERRVTALCGYSDRDSVVAEAGHILTLSCSAPPEAMLHAVHRLSDKSQFVANQAHILIARHPKHFELARPGLELLIESTNLVVAERAKILLHQINNR